jgi:hypothetical protein
LTLRTLLRVNPITRGQILYGCTSVRSLEATRFTDRQQEETPRGKSVFSRDRVWGGRMKKVCGRRVVITAPLKSVVRGKFCVVCISPLQQNNVHKAK